MFGILKKLFGSHHRRFVKKCQPIVARINALELEYQKLTDEQLKAKTVEFRQRYARAMEAAAPLYGKDATKKLAASRKVLDDLLPEAFAAVKNAARRLNGQPVTYTGTADTWKMLHYDVQLIGGICLHSGYIAEMQTGEGKTLTSTLPLYLNALTGRNCQLVTVNEYLAQRDAEWMGYLYRFLGLTVGVILNQQSHDEKRQAYACDITYGTASEFGFDYLRDNGMATRSDQQVQREHYYCIVDEVDSVLVDEARVPLIITGPVFDETDPPYPELKPAVSRVVSLQARLCNKLATEAEKELEKGETADLESAWMRLFKVKMGMPKNRILMKIMENGSFLTAFEKYDNEMHSDMMKKEKYAAKEELYFTIDERHSSADLTELGRKTLAPGAPDAFTLPDLPTEFMMLDRDSALSDEERNQRKQKLEELFAKRSEDIHCISQLLRAYSLYERDKDYIVADGRVVIIDPNNNRAMPGRRWSDGLHQAVEAKEGVKIERETQTFATITIQNYFRLYDKLAGMTGTAETEAGEFHDIYALDVRVIPTHKPCIRVDENDVVYKTRREKFSRVVSDIREAHKKGQPVLCGTSSVSTSEHLSQLLMAENIPHNVLNAKHHQREAEIISVAGQRGAVTVATNMAGRGTDIKLGAGVAELGGLLVLGTERHESRRIDRQLRGRCSRQGDPGRSKFFVSLEDDLMRIFANNGAIGKLLQDTFKEGDELTDPLLNRSIELAQKRVEQGNYGTRKRLLQYDDVLNRQREVIYGIRNDAIHSQTPRDIIFEMIREELEERLETVCPNDGIPETIELERFVQWVNGVFPIHVKPEALKGKDMKALLEDVVQRVQSIYQEKMALEEASQAVEMERIIVIRSLDRNWREHLTEMDELRRSVSLRSYGQKDPLIEYKSEGYKFFVELMNRVRLDICTAAFRSFTSPEALQRVVEKMSAGAIMVGPSESGSGTAEARRSDGSVVPIKAAGASAVAAVQEASPQTTSAAQASEQKPQQTPAPALPKIETIVRELPKIGRNEKVIIRKAGETRTLKFKVAEPLLRNEGWQLIGKAE